MVCRRRISHIIRRQPHGPPTSHPQEPPRWNSQPAPWRTSRNRKNPTASPRKCFLDQHKQGHQETLQGVPNLPGTPVGKFPGVPECSWGSCESMARYLQRSFWYPWHAVPASCRPLQPLSHCGGDSRVGIQRSGCQDNEVSLWFFGWPSCIRSDNGTQYTGHAFQNFVKSWGITHMNNSPPLPTK